VATFQLQPEIAQLGAAEVNKLLRSLEGASQETARAINKNLGGQVTKTVVVETRIKDGKRIGVAVEKEYLSGVDNIRKELNKIGKVEIGSVTSLRQQVNEAKQARDAIAKYQQSANGLTVINEKWRTQGEKVKELSAQLRAADGSGFWERIKGDLGIGQLTSFANGLSQIVNGFQSVSIIVGQVIGSINNLTDALAGLQTFSLAFQAIGQGAGGAQQALLESSRIALNLGVSIQTVRNGFQQLTPVILNSGGSLSDVSSIIESLSSRFAAFGISGDRARRVTNGIIQAFGKGRLQAEELTQQIAEADPAFGTDFARALGVSTAELLKLVKAGQITTDVLISTIPKLSKVSLLYGNLGTSATDAANELAKGSGQTTVTLDQVRNKIASINQLSFESLARSTEPFLIAIVKIQAILADFFSQLSKSSTIKTFAEILGGITDSLGLLLQALLNTANGVLTVTNVFAPILNFLLKFPGVAEVAGIAIIAKLVQPLKLLGQGFTGAIASGGAFSQAFGRLTSPIKDLRTSIQGAFTRTKASTAVSASAAAGFEKQAKSLTTLSNGYAAAGRAAEQQKAKIASLQRTLSSGAGSLAPTQRVVIGNEIQKAQQQYDRFVAAQERARQKASDVSSSIARSGQAIGSASGSAKTASAEYQRLTRSLGSLQTVNANASKGLNASGQELANVKARMNTLTQSLNNGTISSAAYAQQMTVLTARSGELTNRIERLGTIQASTGQRIEGVKGRLGQLAQESQKSGGVISRLSGSFSRFSSAAVGAARGAAGAIGGIAAALGPVTLAFLALGVVQSAYATATAKATEETARSEASLKSLSEIVKRLSNEELDPPKPEGLEALWKNYSTQVAFFLNEIGKTGSNVVKLLKGDFESIERLDVSQPFDALFGAFNEGNVASKQLVLNVEAGIKGIENETEAINKATEALKKFGDSDEAATSEGKIKLATEYKNLEDQIETTQTAFNALSSEVAKVEKEYAKTGDAATKLRLEGLRSQLTTTGKGLQDARRQLDKTAKSLNLLSDDAIKKSVSTLGALGEEAKKLKTNLENAAPGTTEFNQTAASIGAVELAIEKLNKAAKDPAVIRAGIDAKETDKLNELVKLQEKLKKETAKPEFEQDPQVIKNTRQQIAEINRDIENLRELRIQINANSIENAKQEISKIEDQIVKVDVDSSELPKLIEELLRAKQEAENIEDKKASITIDYIERGIASGSLNNSLNNTNQLVSLIEGRIASINIDSPELPGLIDQLIDTQQRVQDLNNEKALVTIEVVEKRIASGDSSVSIKTLDEQAQRIRQVIETLGFGDPRLPGLVQDLVTANSRAQTLKEGLDKITRTPYQVKIDFQNIQAELKKSQANLRFTGVNQGPEREAAALSADSIRDIKVAQADYKKEIEAAEKLRERGIISEEKKKELITEASNKLESSTNNAKANLITAANSYRKQIEDAENSIKNIILAKPQFFTSKEIENNRKKIERDYEETLNRVRAETGDYNFTPRFTGTPEEILKQKQEFVETRKNVKDLEEQIQSLAKAITELTRALSKVNQVDAELPKVDGSGNAVPNAAQNTTSQPQESFVVNGEIIANGQRYLLLLDQISGATTTVTEAEARRLGILSQFNSQYSNVESSAGRASQATQDYADALSGIEQQPTVEPKFETNNEKIQQWSEYVDQATGGLSDATGTSSNISDNLGNAATNAKSIADSISSLQGLNVNVKVTGVQGYWTGGPTTAGQLLRINELGQEGFVTASGQMKPINKPRNALWRAPSTGYVIPAHIWSEINTPSGVVGSRQPTASISSGGSIRRIASMIRSAIATNNNAGIKEGLDRLASLQAGQAVQLGKLSHAVGRLNEKDWNVKVNVTPKGGDGYLGMINRGM
jgi:tape measure domain-containing protein